MTLIDTLKSPVKAWLARKPGRLEASIDSILAARVVLRRTKRALLAVDSRLWNAYLCCTAPKLHIGCGEHILPGWLNTDYFPAPPHVMHLNAAGKFFFPSGSFEAIYSEHLIEHLTERGGHTMLNECFRSLKPGGTIRIATPNLERLIDVYSRPDSGGNRNYVDWSLENSIRDVVSRSPLAVFNQLLRGWGHLFLYDRAGLHAALQRAGFDGIVECSVGQSGTKCMVGLENDSRMPTGLHELETMIFEARKPITGDVCTNFGGRQIDRCRTGTAKGLASVQLFCVALTKHRGTTVRRRTAAAQISAMYPVSAAAVQVNQTDSLEPLMILKVLRPCHQLPRSAFIATTKKNISAPPSKVHYHKPTPHLK